MGVEGWLQIAKEFSGKLCLTPVGSKEQESNGSQVRSEAAFCVLLGLGLFTSSDLDATSLELRLLVVPPVWQFYLDHIVVVPSWKSYLPRKM